MQLDMRNRGVAFGSTTTRWGSWRLRVRPQPLPLRPSVEGESVAAVVEVHHEATPEGHFPSDGFGESELQPPLADVPLIVEDLLLRAKRLADAGAPTEGIEKILERVAALREGRG